MRGNMSSFSFSRNPKQSLNNYWGKQKEKPYFLLVQHIAIIAFILGLISLHSFGYLHYALDSIGGGRMSESNSAFIIESENAATETFLVFSTIKAGLALMQSSSAGVSFIVDMDLQVGQILQSLKEVVDVAWSASLVSMSSLFTMHLITKWSETLTNPLLHIFFVALIAHYLTHHLSPKFYNLSARIGAFCLLLVLTTHLVIPLTIYSLSVTSKEVSEIFAKDAHNEISTQHKDLMIQSKAGENLRDQASASLKAYENLEGKLDDKLVHMTKYIVQHVAVIVFNMFIFPGVFFLGLSYLLHKASLQIFRYSNE